MHVLFPLFNKQTAHAADSDTYFDLEIMMLTENTIIGTTRKSRKDE